MASSRTSGDSSGDRQSSRSKSARRTHRSADIHFKGGDNYDSEPKSSNGRGSSSARHVAARSRPLSSPDYAMRGPWPTRYDGAQYETVFFRDSAMLALSSAR